MKNKLREDPKLRLLVDQITLPDYDAGKDPYYSLLRSIAFQQLAGKAAQTIFGRFLKLFEDEYPHPDLLAVMETEVLRAAGLSGQKANYMRNVAQFHLEKGISLEILQTMGDEEIIHYLTQIKGVGKWTVEMLLMFTLHRPDVFPADDLGIQQAIVQLYGLESKGKQLKEEMIRIAEKWKPARTLACKYLWLWKDTVI